MTALSNGNYIVNLGDSRIASFDRRHHVLSSSNCSDRDLNRARRAIEAYEDEHPHRRRNN